MDNNLLFYRSISDILRLFVVPEVEGRVDNGSVKVEELPLELRAFRAIQRQLPDGSIQPVVEINNEINLILEVRTKQAVQAGEPVTLDKIHPEECFIVPPVYDEQPAAYFLCQTFLLDYLILFDCRANQPGLYSESWIISRGKTCIFSSRGHFHFAYSVLNQWRGKLELNNLQSRNWFIGAPMNQSWRAEYQAGVSLNSTWRTLADRTKSSLSK